jgi:hypothetical protein
MKRLQTLSLRKESEESQKWCHRPTISALWGRGRRMESLRPSELHSKRLSQKKERQREWRR